MKPHWFPITRNLPRLPLGTQAWITLGFALLALIIGTIGYRLIEQWSILDSFYMTLITITTVGFGEVKELSPKGRLFTIFLILGGIGVITYASSAVVQYIASGELQSRLVMRRRQRMLSELQDHYIVCGFGRMGRHVSAELERQQKPFVIIDINESGVEACREAGYQAILGDGADDHILEEAGIFRAHSLIAAVSSDAQNVFITLTARSLCPDLIIVARANSDEAEPKLHRAGANQVIVPYAISGRRMVSSADNPAVVDFLDVVMYSPELELWLEGVTVMPNSKLAGQSLRESNLRAKVGVNILMMRLPNHSLDVDPNADIPIEAGTHLIVLGTRQQLDHLTHMASSNE